MQYVSAFHSNCRIPDNASVHNWKYTTPAARALADLCWAKKTSGDYRLMKEKDGEWTVNANALSNAMSAVGLDLPQPTITRLLQGKESKPATVKLLAEFFSVDAAAVRGEVPRDTKKRLGGDRWPFDTPFDDFANLEVEQQHHIAVTLQALVAGYKAENAPRRRKKSGD